MTSQDTTASPQIRKLRSDESDEFVELMKLMFKDSIEENRLDADELWKIMKKLHSPFYRILTRAMGMRMEFYVAEIDGNIASGILLNIEKDKVYVSDLMTHLRYRRQGLARKLLQLSFTRARELGKSKVCLDIRADDVNALNLHRSEGFEPTYRSGRFELDSAINGIQSTSNELIIREITKINNSHIDTMLDDCYPASYLESIGRRKILKDLIPSRAIRFLVRRLAGDSIHIYGFYVDGDENPRGIIVASQSGIEQRINLSSPILLEKDNDLLLEVIPRILELETGYTGVTTATVSLSMHRTDTISKFENLGFKKMRESISMAKIL